jgi:phosphoglycolate phosphatase
MGPPLRAIFPRLLQTSDLDLVERAVRLYRERFSKIGIFENELYPAIHEMLEDARHVCSRLAVVTSKPGIYANRIVEHFSLGGFFNAVYGPDLPGNLDDKAELLGHALKTEQVKPSETVMVGDRSIDVLAAAAHGAHSIGVLWGYGSENELIEAGASQLCAAPPDLGSCLRALP